MSDVTIRQLASMPIGDLIRGLENEEFSVLKAAHSAKLRAEMRGTGLICRAVLWLASVLAGGTKKYRNIRKMRKKLASMLAWGAPCKITGKPEREADCIMMGFNHPSLGEIARFVYVHLNYFDERLSLFSGESALVRGFGAEIGDLETAWYHPGANSDTEHTSEDFEEC